MFGMFFSDMVYMQSSEST